MHVISLEPDGTARCLYTEALPLHELGALTMSRASQIEFNAASQEWEVITEQDGVLFSHASRSVCLTWEIEYFNQQLLRF